MPELAEHSGVRLEVREVVLLLEARVAAQLAARAVPVKALRRDRVGHDDGLRQAAVDRVLDRRELVVEHRRARDAQEPRGDRDVVRAVAEREVEASPARPAQRAPPSGPPARPPWPRRARAAMAPDHGRVDAMALAQPTVWAKSRAVTSTSAPRARSRSITGRSTRTCGEFVRSTQTRIRKPTLPSPRDAALRAPRARIDHGQARQLGDDRRRRPRPAGDLRADDAREHAHPDPVRGDDAVRRLQRRQGHVLAVRGRQRGASLANLLGSCIAYAIGYYGRLEPIERHHWLHVKQSHLDWADRWFEKYGACGRLLQPHAADHPHVHLAAGRRRADAVRPLRPLHDRSAASPGSSG